MVGPGRGRTGGAGRQAGALIGAAVLVLLGRPLVAQEPGWLQRVDEATACYARLDYDCVIDRLSGLSVVDAAREAPRPVVETAVRLLVVAFVVRGVPERARWLLQETLSVWPDYRLVGEDLGPQFQALFEQAQAGAQGLAVAQGCRTAAHGVARFAADGAAGRAQAEGVATWARALASTSAPGQTAEGGPVVLRVAAGPAAELLTGRDADDFDTGLGLSARLESEWLAGLVLEVGVLWQRHGVRLTDLVEDVPVDLTVLDVSAAALYPWRFGVLRVLVGLGAGYSAFGFDTPFERGGALLAAPVRLEVRFLQRARLTLEVRPQLVMAEGSDGLVVSSPVVTGVSLGLDLF